MVREEGVPSPAGGQWQRTTIRNLVGGELYRPLSTDEAAASGLLSQGAMCTLDPVGTYGLWTFNKKQRKKWKERGADGAIRNRYSVVARPREEWQGVAVDLSASRLSRAHVDAARERVSSNARCPPSTVAERFWELSGGIVRCGVCGCALSPHTTKRVNRNAPYYRCFQRYNSGPRDCTNTRTVPAEGLEQAVWESVHAIVSNPREMQRAYEKEIEARRKRFRDDPEHETRTLAASLAKLAELEDQRKAVAEALERATDRRDGIEKLRRDVHMIFARFEQIRCQKLLRLVPEDRRALYNALRLRVDVNGQGNVRISGAFDLDIVELLPTDGVYRVSEDHGTAKPYDGVVTLDSPSRETSSPPGRRGR